MKTIINCQTGEINETELSAEEISQNEQFKAEAQTIRQERETAEQAQADLKASAKAKLIAGDPLTAEEADTIVL